MTKCWALIFCALLIFANVTQALYILLQPGEKRCFLEEVPKDTLIEGSFKAEDVTGGPGSPNQGIIVSVVDGNNDIVMQKYHGTSGQFAFTSTSGGEHTLCFKTNTTRWSGTGTALKLTFAIHTGADAVNYEELAKQDHLTQLEAYVREVSDRVRGVRAEQSYQRIREIEFRDTSELTNSRVAWFSIAQLVILVVTGQYTLWHLKSFFRSKKLVR